MKDSENYYGYIVVDNPVGKLQDYPENDYLLYVDQSCGISGDDFHGTVCMSLPCEKYLMWSYYM